MTPWHNQDGTWTFRTLDYSYPGLFVPSTDYSYLGLFVPWTVRTLLDCSYHGLFVPSLDFSYHGLLVPSLDDSYRDARLTKINVSYQNVPVFSVSQKIPPEFFLTFSPNGWEFLVQILFADYTFPSTVDYKLLFNYFQPWRSYAILSATHHAQNVHHRPKRTLGCRNMAYHCQSWR